MFDENTFNFLGNLGIDQEEVAQEIKKSGRGLQDILNKKTCNLIFRCSPLEKYSIEQKALNYGFKKVSEFIVTSLVIPEDRNIKKCSEMLKATNRIGNNLNQITRTLHIEGTATEELLQELKEIRLQLSMINNTYKDL